MTCFKLLRKLWLVFNNEFKESFAEENRRLWYLKCNETNKLIDLQAHINGLIEESTGVTGLHLNGELADWDWLINNEWLPVNIRETAYHTKKMANKPLEVDAKHARLSLMLSVRREGRKMLQTIQMKVYDITSAHEDSPLSCVVAKDMGDAERLFQEKYPNAEILNIELYASRVIVAKEQIWES